MSYRRRRVPPPGKCARNIEGVVEKMLYGVGPINVSYKQKY
jgi:hypothetical protein